MALSAAACDEVEALCAIYGEDCDASGAAGSGVLRLALPEHDAALRLLLPAGYPGVGAAPRVEATLRGRQAEEAAAATKALQDGLAQAAAAAPPGEVFLFSYVEWARECLAQLAAAAPPPVAEPRRAPPPALDEALAALLAPRVRHGECVPALWLLSWRADLRALSVRQAVAGA